MSPLHPGPAPEVITLGECMASFVALERGPLADTARHMRTTVAGAEANVAVGLARLEHTAAFIGRVGDDGLGRVITRTLRGEGVDVRHLRVDAAATGVMIRELRDLGPAEVVYWRAASAGSRLDASDVEAAGEFFDHARWLHLTGITPALSSTAAGAVEAALARAAERGLTTSLDINMRRRLWSEAQARPVLAALAARCEVVLGGLDEVALVAGLAETPDEASLVDPETAADAVLRMGPLSVVVKLGARGALERRRTDAGPVTERADALSVPQIHDPVGAGDAFTAGYIAARLEDRTMAEALRVANACGAAAVSSVGDQSGLPTRAELDRLLASGGPDALR